MDLNAVVIQRSICSGMPKSTFFMLCGFLKCQLEESLSADLCILTSGRLQCSTGNSDLQADSLTILLPLPRIPFLSCPYIRPLKRVFEAWQEGRGKLTVWHMEEGYWPSSWKLTNSTCLQPLFGIGILWFVAWDLVWYSGMLQFEVFFFCHLNSSIQKKKNGTFLSQSFQTMFKAELSQ